MKHVGDLECEAKICTCKEITMPHPNGQLTAEEIEPTDEDVLFARKLVCEGWHSTSGKFRRIARFKLPAELIGKVDLLDDGLPRGKHMLHPDLAGTALGAYFIRLWNDRRHTLELRGNESDLVEKMELTVRQWVAFKRNGGPTA